MYDAFAEPVKLECNGPLEECAVTTFTGGFSTAAGTKLIERVPDAVDPLELDAVV